VGGRLPRPTHETRPAVRPIGARVRGEPGASSSAGSPGRARRGGAAASAPAAAIASPRVRRSVGSCPPRAPPAVSNGPYGAVQNWTRRRRAVRLTCLVTPPTVTFQTLAMLWSRGQAKGGWRHCGSLGLSAPFHRRPTLPQRNDPARTFPGSATGPFAAPNVPAAPRQEWTLTSIRKADVTKREVRLAADRRGGRIAP
jgi:hypothetical protein